MKATGEYLDQDNFSVFFEKHYDSVYYWFLRRGLGGEASRELTQDVFVAAYRNLSSFRGEANPRTWLFQITRNIYRNHLRDRRTLKRSATEISLSEPLVDPGESGGFRTLEMPDPDTVDPEREALARESNRSLYGALSDLPHAMRQCVELRLEDFKYREIAEVMGFSVAAVKSNLYQARQRLRERLGTSEERRNS